MILLIATKLWDWVEYAGVISGVLCVWLAARNHIWNWPSAMLSTVLYMFLFFHVHLFSDTLLQIIFLGFQSYGWYHWSGSKGGDPLPVARLPIFGVFICILGIAAVTGLWYSLIVRYFSSASYPFWDSLTMVISLAAIFLQGKRKIFSWHLWIAADIIYIPLYINKDLQPTAMLYFIFLCLALYGWWHWLKVLKLQENSATL